MALIPLTLQSGFLEMARNKPKSPAETAKRWAKIYSSYARLGQISGSPGAFTGLEELVLEKTLLGALKIPLGVPITLASAWAVGLSAFWLLPPIAFIPGPVTAVLGAPVLVPTLTVLYSVPNPDALLASTMAAALHAATLTVTVPPNTLL